MGDYQEAFDYIRARVYELRTKCGDKIHSDRDKKNLLVLQETLDRYAGMEKRNAELERVVKEECIRKDDVLWIVETSDMNEGLEHEEIEIYGKYEDAVRVFRDYVKLAQEMKKVYGYEEEDGFTEDDIKSGQAYHEVWQSGEYNLNHIVTKLSYSGVR